MMMYIVLMLPAIVFTIWASFRVKNIFRSYENTRSGNGYTGYEVAKMILEKQGLSHVKIEESKGFLSDHYDTSSRTLRLSSKVYHSSSIAAVGVAAHEVGHAIQQAKSYAPLSIRQALVPITQISSWAFNILIFVGLFASMAFSFLGLMKLAVLFLGVTTLFSLITLPVEFNASSRARKMLVGYGIVTGGEDRHVGKVLNAAALTYCAAAASSLMTLIYYLLSFSSSEE